MTRVPLVAGNWKMNKTLGEAVRLVEALMPQLDSLEGVESLVCPPFTALAPVAEALRGSRLKLGAQNLYWLEAGAYTGEISALMLKDLCEYVIVGHSERRQYFGETDETVNLRLRAALGHQLKPILCIGETLAERDAGQTLQLVGQQLRQALTEVPARELHALVIAYEPVWAIGTGRAASPADALEVIDGAIRATFSELYGSEAAGRVRVLYGGSVGPKNARSFFELETIDGALVGGASLRAEDFVQIAEAAAP